MSADILGFSSAYQALGRRLVPVCKLAQISSMTCPSQYGSLQVTYTFAVPSSTKNTWTDKPSKTIVTQFYITTWNTLIGTVGGTLGLFVGLSFLGIGEWLLDKASTFFTCATKNHHKHNLHRNRRQRQKRAKKNISAQIQK